MLKIIISSILICLLTSVSVFPQDSNIYRNTDMGVEIRKPDRWQFEEQSKSPLTLFVMPPLEQEELKTHIFAVLVVAVFLVWHQQKGFRLYESRCGKAFWGIHTGK